MCSRPWSEALAAVRMEEAFSLFHMAADRTVSSHSPASPTKSSENECEFLVHYTS